MRRKEIWNLGNPARGMVLLANGESSSQVWMDLYCTPTEGQRREHGIQLYLTPSACSFPSVMKNTDAHPRFSGYEGARGECHDARAMADEKKESAIQLMMLCAASWLRHSTPARWSKVIPI
jgi:hypothetical protein